MRTLLLTILIMSPLLAIGSGTALASPPCTVSTASLDSASYTASVNATFAVSMISDANLVCGGAIQDNTSGSWGTVPAQDTDLDCYGASCSTSGGTFSRILRCRAVGTYTIRAWVGTVGSSTSTVTCTAMSPTITARITGAVIKNAVVK